MFMQPEQAELKGLSTDPGISAGVYAHEHRTAESFVGIEVRYGPKQHIVITH
jgi:hypothetical protein